MERYVVRDLAGLLYSSSCLSVFFIIYYLGLVLITLNSHTVKKVFDPVHKYTLLRHCVSQTVAKDSTYEHLDVLGENRG
jgi:hypothetical protein